MSRSGARPKYLGGIGLMLDVAHICPRCGQRLPESQSATTWHLSGRGCRPTVFAALPEPEAHPPMEEELPPVPVTRRIQDFEVPSARAGDGWQRSVAGQSPPPGLSRALAIPWLRPPDLGEVL